jgi:ElaB/YqjD/DUF883 family membrane-anchored ribosome-binding protein
MAEEHHMNKGPAVSPQREGDGEQNRRQQTGSSSSASGGNLQSSGTSRRTKSGRRAAGESAQVWDEATAGIRSLKENTDEYVRKNPTKAVFTALAIGFVFGLMRHR